MSAHFIRTTLIVNRRTSSMPHLHGQPVVKQSDVRTSPLERLQNMGPNGERAAAGSGAKAATGVVFWQCTNRGKWVPDFMREFTNAYKRSNFPPKPCDDKIPSDFDCRDIRLELGLFDSATSR